MTELPKNITDLHTAIQEAKIDSNMKIFKSIVKPEAIRGMNKKFYKAIMRWLRTTQYILLKQMNDYILGRISHTPNHLRDEIVNYFVPMEKRE